MNLFQINAEIEQLENALEDGLLIDEETGELLTIEDALNQLRMDWSQKVENIAMWCKNLASDALALKAEEDNLAQRRKAAEAKRERLMAYLQSALTREDGTFIAYHGVKAAVTMRKNPPKVVIAEESALPPEFMIKKIEMKPDKASIKEVLSRGIEVPGARLEQTRSVIIK